MIVIEIIVTLYFAIGAGLIVFGRKHGLTAEAEELSLCSKIVFYIVLDSIILPCIIWGIISGIYRSLKTGRS